MFIFYRYQISPLLKLEYSERASRNILFSFKKKDVIREKYRELNEDFREMYKWYFYHQLCLLRQKQFKLKDLMWLYLNDEPIDFELSNEYHIFCEKRNIMYKDFYNVKLTKM